MSLVGQRLGPYQLEELIGSGGMGEVYRARKEGLGWEVAVKVLHDKRSGDATLVGRFFQEAKTLTVVSHPNIVEVIDYGHNQGRFFLVTRYLQGQTLQQRLKDKPLSVDESLRVMRQCASALAACHDLGIIHRDLKPQNLILRQDLSVKLVDFGLAKLMRREGRVVKTETGQVFGTPLYMSPEQAMDASQVDARSDVYSLGVIFYELLAGRVPFSYPTYSETLLAHKMEPVVPPSRFRAIPPEVEAICISCLEKEPDQRFASMHELGEALARPESYLARRRTSTNLVQEVKRRPRWLAPLLGPLLIGIAAAVWWLHSRTQTSPPTASKLAAPAAPMAIAPSPAPPAMVSLTILATPPGATVMIDGAVVGRTPLRLRRAASPQPLEVELRHAGNRTVRRSLTPDRDREIEVVLPALRKAAAGDWNEDELIHPRSY